MPEQSISLHEDSVAVIPQKAEKKGGKRIGYYYIILKSLKESRKNDVVKCIYIKGLTNFGLCVIKEGSRGDTKDKHGRDIQDRLKWQRELHDRLAKKVRMPKLLGSFEENGNYYLVMEYIKGKPLHSIIRRSKDLRKSLLGGEADGIRMLRYLEQMVQVVRDLHENGVVHRDVTINNFMVMPNDKIAVIDMELSYSLTEQYPDPPFTLGTFGYMSPEQEQTATPTVKEDIFAVGAILLHAWTNISPYKFAGMPMEDLVQAVPFFVEEADIASIILQCMNKDAHMRPMPETIIQVLKKNRQDKEKKIIRPLPVRHTLPSDLSRELLDRGIQALGESVLADKEQGWFAEHLSQPAEHTNDIKKAWYASFGRGASGVLYFLARASAAGYEVSRVAIPVEQGIELIRKKYTGHRAGQTNSGLHFGSDGIAMALAECHRLSFLGEDQVMREEWPQLLSQNTEGFGLIGGMAGQGIANLACAGILEGTREKYFAEELMKAQQADGSWVMGKKRPTYHLLNGQAGVIYFLLRYGAYSGNKDATESAIKGIRHLISKAGYSPGGGLTWKDTRREHSSDHWWCEGSPGIALMFLKAYELLGDPLYATWAGKALSGHDEREIWSGLSLCHGVAGLGEVYLEAAHVLKEEQWNNKAWDCLQVILHSRRLTSKGAAYWFVEKERRPVANIMLGNSGILHFLLRYQHTNRFGFPGL
ncbi:protein kinase/lanthionine synthetase C family protein [Chitinophaga sp. 22620]|uniref:protein kinase/lanthionine synthetase C family protein n=1 Tax=Chitinophaga sp. 22620 TaxID=3453952 RepID=UPI003F846D48